MLYFNLQKLCIGLMLCVLLPWSSTSLSLDIAHIDLARGQTATQSSTAYGGVAGRAVDGNFRGSVYSNGSVTATSAENQPWWQVDLAHTYQLSRIVIWNRADCCAERLANFYVFVSDKDMRGRALAELLADNSVWNYHQVTALAANGNLNLPTPSKGRFIRIQKVDTGILSLAEVRVYGVNQALGKNATQSSTLLGEAVATRAVDGDVDGNFDVGSISSTTEENQPWWQLDLGVQTAIGKMKLYNRRDALSKEFSHFYVFVSDSDMRGRSLDSLVNDSAVWKSFEVVSFGVSYVVAGHSKGRYVRIQRKTDGLLQIAEVAVYGAPANQVLPNKPNPAIYGEWSEVYDWPHIAIHASLLPNGKILTFDATPDDFGPVHDPVASPNITTRASIWNPVTKRHTDAANDTEDDLFCSGHTQMADGNYFMAGGTTNYNASIASTNIYDSINNTWRAGPKMQFPRWYPTVSNLGTGELILAGGRGGYAEIYNPETNSLRTLDGILFGRTGNSWPFIMQAPNGKVIFAGGSGQTSLSFINTEGRGELTETSSSVVSRNGGSFVVFDKGRMLVTGGNGGSSTADIIEMNTAAVEATDPLNLQRVNHNSIVLPDGKVVIIGGNLTSGFCNDESGAYAPEIWNPATGQWRLLASQQHPRQYHSTAVLLPDARIWSGGQGYATTVSNQIGRCSYQNNAEVFSPPYLFNANGTPARRPLIDFAPSTIAYNGEFSLQTQDATQIKSVSLIRLSSATHAANFSQRFVPLSFEVVGGELRVESPVDTNLAPSGFYMLFIVNNNGTPSLAKMVKVGGDTVPIANPDSANVTSSATVTLSPLANDTGAGLTLQAPNAYSQRGGRVVLSGNQLRYTPKPGFNGLDKIWYTVRDSQDRTTYSVINLNVSGNDTNIAPAPVANPDTVNVTSSATVTLSPLANDTGSGLVLQAPNAWSLKGGRVALSGNQLRYTPKSGFNDLDKIWYNIKDSQGRTAFSVINLNVSGNGTTNSDVPPSGSPDNVTTTTGTTITIDVLANDTGNGLTLTAPNVWSLRGGAVSLVSNKLVYRSKTGFTGNDNIWYVFSDSQGRSSNGQVNITVNAGNTTTAPFPIANADTYTVPRNTTRTLNILANDTPSRGLAIDTLYEYSSKGGRTTRANNSQEVSYTPKVGFTGSDDFWYVMIDSQGRKNSAKVTINVTP